MIASDIVYHNAALPSFNDMTVDEWFEFWMKNLVPDLRSNTRRNYNDRYRFNIQPVIGKMKIRDVRTMETYVHVTDDSKLQAVKQFEENTPESLKVAQLVYLVSDDSKNWCQIGVKPHC